MATKTTRMKAPKFYVMNMGIARSGKLAVNSEHGNFMDAARAAARDFQQFVDFGFTYLLPVIIVSAPSKTVASLPLAAEGMGGTGRRFEGVYAIVKGKPIGRTIHDGSFARLMDILEHGASAGSPKRAGTPKRASKPKSAPKRSTKKSSKRSPKQLSFPKKLGFSSGMS